MRGRATAPGTAAMTTEPVTCPYCNALVTVAPGTAGGQRVPCRRCGESFTLSPHADCGLRIADCGLENQAGSSRERAALQSPVYESAIRNPQSAIRNRWLALVILGVMACMAAGALAFALSTEKFRRDNDKGITQPRPKRRVPLDEATPPAPATPTPPAKLDALAWLPPDTNLVLGVHVREVAGADAGKALLRQPIRAGGFNLGLSPESLLGALKFQVAEVDHLVLGITAEESDRPALLNLPRAVLLVRTRQDYDERELRERLKAERVAGPGDRAVYEFRASDALKPSVCFIDGRTVAFALVPGPLQDVPASPRADLGQLPRPLREVLKKRVGPVGPLWVAGHSDDWSKTPAKRLFANRERLAKVRTFAVWVQLDDPALVRAEFDCGSDQAAKDLQKYLDIPDDGADWKAARADGWLTVQGRTKLDNVLGALER